MEPPVMTEDEFHSLKIGSRVWCNYHATEATVVHVWGDDCVRKEPGYAIQLDNPDHGHGCKDKYGVPRVPEGNGWNLWLSEASRFKLISHPVVPLKDQIQAIWEPLL
jgi:hypothetical protein